MKLARTILLPCGLTLGALVLKLALGDLFSPPYLFFFAAVMLSAVVGGLWPGVVATLVSAGLAYAFLLERRLSFRLEHPTDLIGLSVFVVIGVVVSVIANERRRAQGEAVRQAGELRNLLDRTAASEQQYRHLLDNLRAGVVVHAPDTSIIQCNGQASVLLGLTPDQMRGKVATDPGWRFVHEDGTTMPVEEYPVARVLATRAPVEDQVLGVDRPRTGDRVWVLVTAYPEVDDRHELRQVVVTFVDITRRKQAEERLRVSEERHRLLAENASDVVWTMAPDGAITYVSPSVEKVRGFTPAEAMRQSVEEIHTPGSQAISLGYFVKLKADLQAGRPPTPFRGELEYRCKDGSTFWTDVIALPVLGPDGGVVEILGMTRDISERRRVDEAMRLAGLGTLVTGVAHEINNPLGGVLASDGFVLGEVERLWDMLRSGETLDREELERDLGEMREALRDSQDSGRRIARIVKDLALLAHPSAEPTRVRLKDVIEQAMKWLPTPSSAGASFRVEDRVAPDVMASVGQLAQVLVNLVSNAIRSIPQGRPGVVTIAIGPGSAGRARLEVTDDGSGIPPQAIGRIFDPFFTTRPAGQGMGLGLAICRSIVSAHGGTIAVESEVGKGSTFRVELPAAPDKA